MAKRTLEYFVYVIFGCCILNGNSVLGATVTEWTVPAISRPSGSGTVATKFAEDLFPGTSTGITLAATGATAYNLHTDTSHGATFSIDNSGLLTFVSGTLDYETHPSLVLTVRATGDDTVTAEVTIQLTDANDVPFFTPALNGAVVVDGATEGTEVLTLNASYPDTTAPNNVISGYTISDGNTNDDFVVSPSGVIKVNTGKNISMTTTPGYILVVKVTDSAVRTYTGTTTVAVAVSGPCSVASTQSVTMAKLSTILLFAYTCYK